MAVEYLKDVPKEEILFCIAPPFAKHYGILPVNISSNNTVLHVATTRDFSKSELEQMTQDFRKIIKVEVKISEEEFTEAFDRFYAGLLPS